MTPTTARHTLPVPVMTNYPLVVSKTKTAQSGHVFLACCRCGNDKIHRRLDGHLEILVPSMCAMLWDFFIFFQLAVLAILGNVEEGGSTVLSLTAKRRQQRAAQKMPYYGRKLVFTMTVACALQSKTSTVDVLQTAPVEFS